LAKIREEQKKILRITDMELVALAAFSREWFVAARQPTAQENSFSCRFWARLRILDSLSLILNWHSSHALTWKLVGG
jgi:hypothetical protein